MKALIDLLNENYAINFDRIEMMRDMGSTSYSAYSDGEKYFLRVINPAFYDTAMNGADIQLFLQKQGFPVPRIILTNEDQPYARTDNRMLILYEFIEGSDVDPEQDAEAIGALVGRLHQVMKTYPGNLAKRDRYFFIGRYIDILQRKQYPRTDEYLAYGDALWEDIRDLPRGYCHGDMYDGNIRKAQDGRLYIHDFDTSCEGFPMYDPTLICNKTQYFEFEERNYERSNRLLSRFVPEYAKYSPISPAEVDAFHALIAIQHFSTQATVMEIFGIDCLDEKDMDNQLDWLYKWREQCESNMS